MAVVLIQLLIMFYNINPTTCTKIEKKQVDEQASGRTLVLTVELVMNPIKICLKLKKEI